jgi:hypothetical protein
MDKTAHLNGLKEHARRVKTLEELKERVTPALRAAANRHRALGYVSGIISSDGPHRMQNNLALLEEYTKLLRVRVRFPIFSSTDIFDGDNADRISKDESDWRYFWRGVISESRVTDIFMTPRWEHSVGAIDELRHAHSNAIIVHYLDKDPELLAILTNSNKRLRY